MLKLYTESYFKKDNPSVNFKSPYWYCLWQDPPHGLRYWIERVIELCKTDVTHDLFGLSFADLLEMDVVTFNQLARVIEEIRKERSKQRDALEEQIKT